jgi:hypothetical protein
MNNDLAVKELRAVRVLRERIARKLEVPEPEKKRAFGSVMSVTKNHVTHEVTAEDQDVPRQLSASDQRVMESQASDRRLKQGERIRDTQPVEPVEDRSVVRLTDEQLRNFR